MQHDAGWSAAGDDDDDVVFEDHWQLEGVDVERLCGGEIRDVQDQAFEVFGSHGASWREETKLATKWLRYSEGSRPSQAEAAARSEPGVRLRRSEHIVEGWLAGLTYAGPVEQRRSRSGRLRADVRDRDLERDAVAPVTLPAGQSQAGANPDRVHK
jgi:hypothetical protein